MLNYDLHEIFAINSILFKKKYLAESNCIKKLAHMLLCNIIDSLKISKCIWSCEN